MNTAPPSIHPCHTSVGPVFVVGHARSGTSLVCRLLLDHLGVNFGTESQFIVRYHQKLARYGDLTQDSRLRWLLEDIGRERFFARTRQNFGFVFDPERALPSVSPRTYSGVLRAVFEQFAADQGHVRWGDKTPDYCHHLPLIRQLFPDAQFLHVIRDGRDVAHSLLATGFGPKNSYEAALAWRKTLEEVRRFRDTLPAGAYAEIRYEALVTDPVSTLGAVARFLGIANAEALMEAVTPKLRQQVRAGSLLKWKQHLSWREVECFEAFAGDELTALGYPLQFRPRTAGRSAVEAAFWKGQAVFRRFRNRRYWAGQLVQAGAARARRRVAAPRAGAAPSTNGVAGGSTAGEITEPVVARVRNRHELRIQDVRLVVDRQARRAAAARRRRRLRARPARRPCPTRTWARDAGRHRRRPLPADRASTRCRRCAAPAILPPARATFSAPSSFSPPCRRLATMVGLRAGIGVAREADAGPRRRCRSARPRATSPT